MTRESATDGADAAPDRDDPGSEADAEPSVLVALPTDGAADGLLDDDLRERIEGCGTVEWYLPDSLASDAVAERLPGVEVLLTGWSGLTLGADALAAADDLELVGYIGGSVATLVTEAVYERGVTVVSANRTIAKHVAEGILTLALAHLRNVPALDRTVRDGGWEHDKGRLHSLYDRDVGFVGLGTVGRFLAPLLAPFDVTIRVYDPYVKDDDLPDNARIASLDETLAHSSVVSIHAALTSETVGLLGPEELDRLPENALLVNTARGPIVDEDALVERVRDGHLRAALDVFEQEPLPADHPLRTLDGALCQPHTAGWAAGRKMAECVVADLERFVAGEALEGTVPREQFETMTRSVGD
jgi:phosphoglycerate dehydrogenase-like enzyme